MSKTDTGNFFEDFRIGQIIRHATPKTVTSGDVALYTPAFTAIGLRYSRRVRLLLRSATRTPRSTIFSCFTSCSVRPCPISR